MQHIESKNETLSYDNVFKLMDSYFSMPNVLYSHLPESYKAFIVNVIEYIKNNPNKIYEGKDGKNDNLIYNYLLEFSDIYIRPPLNENGDGLLYPADARDNSSTYSLQIFGTVKQVQEIFDINKKEVISRKNAFDGDMYETKNVHIMSIPLMVRSEYCSLSINNKGNSRECRYDPGGYFIINGSEKNILCLERAVENKPCVYVQKDGSSVTYHVKVNSRPLNPNNMTQRLGMYIDKTGDIILQVGIFSEISALTVMRALGLTTDKEIINYIVYDENDIDMFNLIKIAMEHSKVENRKLILTTEEAMNTLANKIKTQRKYNDKDKKLQQSEKREHLMYLLNNVFLPHIVSSHYSNPLRVKAYFLGYMINKLLHTYLGRPAYPVDDRDSFINKRIDLPGDLLFELFKQVYRKLINECNKHFKKRNDNHDKPLNAINQIKPSIIENSFKSAISTGNWGSNRKGVAQSLQRYTYLQTISALRRIDAPAGDASSTKLTGPRHLHPSQQGFLCFTGDTKVLMGDGTLKYIKDIKNGDFVVSVNQKTLENNITPIKNWFKQDCNKLYEVTTMNGSIIKCTPEHRLLVPTDNGYDFKEVQNMKEGDKLIFNSTDKMQNFINVANNMYLVDIISIKEITPEPVYDFETVNDDHTFIANGIVTSNCPNESPEHANIGLTKHLSMLGSITTNNPEQNEIIYGLLHKSNKFISMDNHSTVDIKFMTKIFLNGEWLGFSKDGISLYTELRKLKDTNNISKLNGIVLDVEKNEIKIYTDGGRLYRPILKVKNNEILLTDKIIQDLFKVKSESEQNANRWQLLLSKYPETIDFIDMEENYFALIACDKTSVQEMKRREELKFEDVDVILNRYDEGLYLDYSHCEIHPTFTVGIIVSKIPFFQHNFGVRNIYSFAQGKQAMGIYASNYRDRLDIGYILYHTQRQLVNTKLSKYINTDALPCGENATVMIGCYTGLI